MHEARYGFELYFLSSPSPHRIISDHFGTIELTEYLRDVGRGTEGFIYHCTLARDRFRLSVWTSVHAHVCVCVCFSRTYAKLVDLDIKNQTQLSRSFTSLFVSENRSDT
jgi:hypothetical protein